MQEKLKDIKEWLGQGSINIFGMPFAGKDTQGGVLADLLGGEVLGGGKILRNSIIPKNIQRDLDAGKLIPTEDYLSIVLPYLSRQEFNGKPLILSSVGRWDGEQYGIVKAAAASAHPLRAVILLTVIEDVARKRRADVAAADDRGIRTDDSADVLETRFIEYHEKTLPVIDYYRSQGLLIEVDGTEEPPEVTNNILIKLHERAIA